MRISRYISLILAVSIFFVMFLYAFYESFYVNKTQKEEQLLRNEGILLNQSPGMTSALWNFDREVMLELFKGLFYILGIKEVYVFKNKGEFFWEWERKKKLFFHRRYFFRRSFSAKIYGSSLATRRTI